MRKMLTNAEGDAMHVTTFERILAIYVGSYYDLPDEMKFYIDGEEYIFEEWVEEYVARLNDYEDRPYDERSSEHDVYVVGKGILAIMYGQPTDSRFSDFTVGMEE